MELVDIAKKFKIYGEIISISPYGNGHINKTYLLKTTTNDYILQKINSYVFKNVDLLMNNIDRVTSYLRSINAETMQIINTIDNKLYFKENDDAYYRIYDFVMNSSCYEEITNMELVKKDAQAFGNLHKQLKDFNAKQIGETIPDFHNTPKRYKDFLVATIENKKDRLKTCIDEVNQIKKYEKEYAKIVDGINEGSINLTITHNDPKINNVLFDAKTDQIRCVIDLDTIMPGSLLYDVGDSFRSLFTGKNESSTDLSLLKVNFDIFNAYISSYLKEMKDVITKRELELLPYSAFLLTIECGMRFLEDYLKGDVYFHVNYDNENLIRARTQITLANDIYNNFDKLNKMVNEIYKSL